MKKMNKSQKVALGTTAGIAGGAAAGIGAAALWPADAKAENVEIEDMEDSPLAEKVAPPEEVQEVKERVVYVNEYHEASGGGSVNPEAEVVGYSMVADQDGNHVADVATVRISGEEVMFMDTDLNGYADQAYYDANHNQIVDEGEIVPVKEGEVPMMGFMENAANINVVQMEGEAAGVAETSDMPDYTNNADITAFNTSRGDEAEVVDDSYESSVGNEQGFDNGLGYGEPTAELGCDSGIVDDFGPDGSDVFVG